ncbi:MAG: lipopolysaccharide biosynthesis protein [Pseudomonadota bacterium]
MTTASNEGLSGKVADGAVWMTGLMIAERGISLVSTIILARLLVPEDFGVVAMCMSVVAALELFAAFGFDVVLIQKQGASRAHYDTAWTLRLLSGVLIASLIVGAAYPTSVFYDEPKVVWPMIAIALGSLLKSFENIGVVDFRKDLRFRREASFRLSQRLSGFLVTVPLALYWRDYWALVAGIVAMNASALVLSYIMRPRVPRFSLRYWHTILGFSSWLLVNNFLEFIRRRAAYFILGRSGGAGALGFLQISQDLANAFTRELVSSANRAIFPGYSRVSTNNSHIAQMFLRVSGLTSTFAVPVSAGIALISHQIIPIVLGGGWSDAIPLLQLLAISGGLAAIGSNCTYVFHARGKPRIVTLVSLIHVILLVPLLVILVNLYGLLGAGRAVVGAGLVTVPAAYKLATLELNLSLREVARAVWRPFAAASAMCAAVLGLEAIVDLDLWSGVLLNVGIGAACYVGVLSLLVWAGNEEDPVEELLLGYAGSLFRRMLGRAEPSGRATGGSLP